jgi:integrase
VSRFLLLSDFGDSGEENQAATRAFPLIFGVHISGCPLGDAHLCGQVVWRVLPSRSEPCSGPVLRDWPRQGWLRRWLAVPACFAGRVRPRLSAALGWLFFVVRSLFCNPLVDPPHVPRAEIESLTQAELRVFLDAVRGDRFEAFYVLAISTGMRRGELLGLEWQHIDLDKATLRVQKALQRVDGRLQLVEPKSANSRRTLTIPLLAVEALRERRRRQLEERLAAGSRWVENRMVFTTYKGTSLDHATVVRSFHRSLESAGLRHQRLHDLRHANATLMLSEGVHPPVVMEMLGHSNIALTLDTYSHVIPALQSDAAALVNAALGRKPR